MDESNNERLPSIIWEIENTIIPRILNSSAIRDQAMCSEALQKLKKFRQIAQQTYLHAKRIVEHTGITPEEYETLQYLITMAEESHLVRIQLFTTAFSWREAGNSRTFRAEQTALQRVTVELEATIRRFHFSSLRLGSLPKAVNG